MPGRALRLLDPVIIGQKRKSVSQNHRMPGRALRLRTTIDVSKFFNSDCQNHRMPGRALRHHMVFVSVSVRMAKVRIIECPEGH